MIRINLLTPEQAKLLAATAKFYQSQRSRPFSERHPELGKMINCVVCDRRHRSSVKCEPMYAVGQYDPEKKVLIAPKTRKGIVGAAAFAKKRIRPHRNAITLQVLERANRLFDAAVLRAGKDLPPVIERIEYTPPEHMPSWQPDMARYTRQAFQEIREKREVRRRIKRQQQQVARGINFGLVTPGTRLAA